MRKSDEVVARHRKTGTKYVAVTQRGGTGLSTVTTRAGSTYLVLSESIEYPRKDSRAGIATELKELAQKLGGGWRIEKGIMPVVVLSIDEARELARKLEKG